MKVQRCWLVAGQEGGKPFTEVWEGTRCTLMALDVNGVGCAVKG